MLNEEKTKNELGYSIDSLSDGSKKKICLTCDYCGSDIISMPKARKKANLIIDKDCCNKCKYIKRKEVSLKRDGVSNSAQRQDVKDKIVQSNREKFGKDYFVQTSDFKEKRKESMLEKYGVEYFTQSESLKVKIQNTLLEKYGVDNPYKIPEVREKAKQSLIDKYGEDYMGNMREIYKEQTGLDNPFQDEDIKKKSRKTCIEKYGTEYAMQNRDIKDSAENTCLEKYGYKNPLSSPEIQEKIKQTNLEKYGYENPCQNQEIKDKIVKNMIESGRCRIFKDKTSKEWAKELDRSLSGFNACVRKHGFEKAIKLEKNISSLEKIVQIWLDEQNIKYVQQYHVENRIADFYLPDHNLILELDGLFWHSERVIEDKYYHANKKALYDTHNLSSLFFRENEINSKFDIVKSIILNKIGKSERIFARKCKIKRVSKKSAKTFLNKNHLMGNGKGDSYGLYYNGVLVSLLRCRRIRNNEWDVSRFCNKLNTSVIGGFSKLLNAFILDKNPQYIQTFTDLRYGEGKYLKSFGFRENKAYPSFKWTDFQNTYNRMRFKGKSGYKYGLSKLWDCGQKKWTLHR